MKPAAQVARVFVLGAATMFMAALLFAGLYLRLRDGATGIGELWLAALVITGAIAFATRSPAAWRFVAVWSLIFFIAAR